MEKITKMIKHQNEMERTGSTIVAKCNAEDFYIFCAMAEMKVKFELLNNRIKFSIK